LLANLTEVDFQTWRDRQAFNQWKRAIWDAECSARSMRRCASGSPRAFQGTMIAVGINSPLQLICIKQPQAKRSTLQQLPFR